MAKQGQKLELTWVGKDERVRLEPRVLVEDPSKSYGDPDTENMLIFGDNLLALKALEQDFAGKIKCIYIDPPFNTGQAFEHYDDGLEHSTWLAMMNARLAVLHRLLAPEGVLFVHLDQEENHYLKIVLDEVYTRYNFLGQVAYERSGVSGIGQGGAFLVNTHEYILCYTKDKARFQVEDDRGATPLEPKDMKRYNRVLVSPGLRVEVNRFVAPSTGEPVVIYQHQGEEINTISLRKFEERYDEIMAQYVENFPKVFRNTSIQKENEFQNRILLHCGDGLYSADYLVSRGKRQGERITAYYWNRQVFAWLSDTAEVREGQIVKTNKLSDFWPHGDLPKADLANEGGVDFRRGKKPETLVKRLIGLVTKAGDWILDSFAGSGTTGAVTHKMGRRWIMVELGEHCHTHIIPRLKKVIDGEDQGGISKTVNWKGGGGFKYYRLAESLLVRDKDLSTNRHPVYIINPRYDDKMLIRAICKIENFRYRNDGRLHGISSESRFLHVTTLLLTQAYLDSLAEDISEEQSLLIYCTRKSRNLDVPENVEIKKIPRHLLEKCDFQEDK